MIEFNRSKYLQKLISHKHNHLVTQILDIADISFEIQIEFRFVEHFCTLY